MNETNTQFKRFLASGFSTVIVDICIYSILINFGLVFSISKAISFISGTVYSYIINKKWTFRAKGGIKTFIKYIIVYLISLNINLSVNSLIINYFFSNNYQIIFFAFLVSTIFSATFNFFFLKEFVFKQKI
tara:strand:+ start:1363 stop:1755 length:393 start_codon:yes stop_codon:yes gene_type:complete